MRLYRAGRESRIPPNELDRRCEAFNCGEWPQLLQCAAAAVRDGNRHRTDADEFQARAARAAALVHLGSFLSAAGRALVVAPLAPGTDTTLEALRDPRPALPYEPLPPEFPFFRPAEPCPGMPACGRPGVEQLPGPAGRPMSTCAHFWTTSLTARSYRALLNGLRKQTCQGRLVRHCVLAG